MRRALLFSLLASCLTPQVANATNDLASSCVIGSSASGCAAYSPQEIYNLYGTTSDGTYYISIGGNSTQVYSLMDRTNSDLGAWILLMKGTKSSTNFNYSSSYFTSNSNTLNPASLTNDVTSDAKFSAYNNLSVKKLLAVFKDPAAGTISSSGMGDLKPNAFGGLVWQETLASTASAYTTLSSASVLTSGTWTNTRYSLYRESNSNSANQIFSYQSGGVATYGFNSGPCTSGVVGRWGVSWNNESNYGSCDAYIGVGMGDYGTGDFVPWANMPTGSQGTGAGKGKTGFQIWGKMADPNIAAPRSLQISQASNTSLSASWLPPATGTVSEYIIQYKLSSGNWSSATTHRVTAPSANPSVNLSGLGAGIYNLRVFARNSATSQSSTTSVDATYTLTPDTTAPTYSSSAVSSNGTQVVLTYNEALSATSAAPSAFTVTAGGVSKTISSVTVSGSTVILNLSSAIRASQIVTFTYTDPTSGDDASAIQDASGNDAATRTSTLVTNNSTVSAAQSALSIASTISTKSYPYSQLLTLSTSGGSGSGAVTYAITAGASAASCALSADTATVTLSATTSGTCLIAATKAGDGEYLSASTATPLTFVFNKAPQSSIDITSKDAIFGTDLTLTSTGGSTGGTFTYTKLSGDCTVSGETLTPTSSGSCIIYSSLATTTNYLAETSTATTITIATSNVSASISLDAGTLVYRQAKVITATASVAGKVTFKVNGKKLPGCVNKRISSLNAYIATCSYKPSTRGYIRISATLTPTNNSYIGSTTTSERLFVGSRSGSR